LGVGLLGLGNKGLLGDDGGLLICWLLFFEWLLFFGWLLFFDGFCIYLLFLVFGIFLLVIFGCGFDIF
jgi:hypothetical protein